MTSDKPLAAMSEEELRDAVRQAYDRDDTYGDWVSKVEPIWAEYASRAELSRRESRGADSTAGREALKDGA